MAADNHDHVAVFEEDIYYFASIEREKSDKTIEKRGKSEAPEQSPVNLFSLCPYPLRYYGEKRANAATLETGPRWL
jgi:hypothetical protein